MSHVTAIARKEFRSYFASPIALIFLFIFAAASMACFFFAEGFFGRNIADIRPLFEWLPLLLIFLCAAITMRLWSEEQKLGTMELLLTLPVRISDLILGKFLAALGLVVLALALTFSLPLTASYLGDLDWGPVIGGYLAVLLVAAAYIAIGLWISSVSENQIISLLLTTTLLSVLYVIGTPAMASFLGVFVPAGWVLDGLVSALESLSVSNRFDSVQRGVIDVRDLAYYAGIVVSFLSLNGLALRAKGWSQGHRTAPQRNAAIWTTALAAGNMVLLSVLLAPLNSLRADLTERGEYSVSSVTKDTLRKLPEPLLLRGYFSRKTHPVLAPIIPQIKDLMLEYGTVSGGQVQVEFVDPRENEDVEKEANQAYGIKSFPFRISDKRDASIVNSYFSILVKYGDEYEVLNFSDLIEVQVSPDVPPDIDVRLRNLEYDLTRAVRKTAYGFQTLEAVFARLDEPAEFFAFVTESTLPDNFKEAPQRIRKVAAELQVDAGDKFKFKLIDPDAENAEETRASLQQKYGFRPFAVSLLSQESFYLHLLLKVGDRYERVYPAESLSEADIKTEVTAALKRAAPGFLKTVGIAKPATTPPQMPPHLRHQQPPSGQDVTRMLSAKLGETFSTRDIDLKTGRVPGDIDLLVVVAPTDFDEKQRFALDQFVMRGGPVVILGGKYELNPQARDRISVKKISTGLDELLGHWGISIEDQLVMDTQNEPFPIPVERDLGGLRIRDMQLVRYPYFVDVRSDGMDKENPIVAGLPEITLQWASPVVVQDKLPATGEEAAPPRTVARLLRSTENAWTSDSTNVEPDFNRFPEGGFGPTGEQASHVLAAAVTGRFPSFFADKKVPDGIEGAQVIKASPDTSRVMVVGSASFINDMVLGLSRQTGSDRFQNNLQFAQNLVDFGVADTALLEIRSRGTFARTLVPLEASEKTLYEVLNYAYAALALGLIAIVAAVRRKSKPMNLETPASTGTLSGPLNSGAEA